MSGTLAELTQIAAEEWARGLPNAQLTQLAIEQWASAQTGPTYAQLTQLALEQWAPVVAAASGGSTAYVMVMA